MQIAVDISLSCILEKGHSPCKDERFQYQLALENANQQLLPGCEERCRFRITDERLQSFTVAGLASGVWSFLDSDRFSQGFLPSYISSRILLQEIFIHFPHRQKKISLLWTFPENRVVCLYGGERGASTKVCTVGEGDLVVQARKLIIATGNFEHSSFIWKVQSGFQLL